MHVRITVETTFDKDAKRIHQLDGISRPHRVTCPEGFGRYLADGKWVFKQVQQAILCDQVEEISRESRESGDCPACSPVRASHDYRRRVQDTLFGRVVQPLISECAVVALDVGALLMLAELDMLDSNPMFLSPFHQLFADVFGAIVDPYGARLSSPLRCGGGSEDGLGNRFSHDGSSLRKSLCTG
jgi:hypothetical protein